MAILCVSSAYLYARLCEGYAQQACGGILVSSLRGTGDKPCRGLQARLWLGLLLWVPSVHLSLWVPGGSNSKESACHAGDPGSVPGLGRSPVEGNGYPVQYCCLENSLNGETRWATVHGDVKSQTRLND